MNENPYAAQSMQTSDFGSGLPSEPARTSTLAIVAFVLSLVSIVLCCIPGLPAVAALLGVFAIIGISKSQGSVKGNGFAIAALIIGILLSVVQTIGLIVINQGFGQIGALNASVEAIEAGQFDTVRAQFPGVPAETLTDEVIADFQAQYTLDAGAFQSSPESLFSMFGAYASSGPALQQMQQPNWPYPNETIPWPATFDSGDGFMLYIPDESATSSGVVMPLSNMGVLAPSGSVYWLLPPGGGTTALPSPPATDGDAQGEAEGENEDAAPADAGG